MSDFQRLRVLSAAMESVCERGYRDTTVAIVVARAGVSRKTFYELFENRGDCFGAAFEAAVARTASVVAPAYRTEGAWSERIRAALTTLLAFLEHDRDTAAFMLDYIAGEGPTNVEQRARVLGGLARVVEEGRSQAGRDRVLSPLTAEVVVGGVIAVVRARVRGGEPHLSALTDPLMWTIVLPYLGPRAAARQLARSAAVAVHTPSRPKRGALDGLEMRMTYRTAAVLAAIAQEPGCSNVEVGARAAIADQSQISKLLSRLARIGLIENTRAAHTLRAANSWCLTGRGSEVEATIARKVAVAGYERRRR